MHFQKNKIRHFQKVEHKCEIVLCFYMWCFRGEDVDLLTNVPLIKLDLLEKKKRAGGGGGESSSYPEETE